MDAAAPITRKQLRGYGASRYLARRLTEPLAPIGKSGNAYLYALDQIVAAVRKYRSKSRLQHSTRQILEQLLTQLLTRIDNVVPLVSGDHETEVSDVAKLLLRQMRRTDKALAEMKATVASIGGPVG